MKYLLFLVFLSGCASKPIAKQYDCVALNPHGVYARMTVDATDEDAAVSSASKVVQALIDKKLIPDNSIAFCDRAIREYPKGK